MKISSRESYLLWSRNNPDKIRAIDKRADVKVKTRYSLGKTLAKRCSREFTITFEEYFQLLSQPCYYCNKELVGVETGVGLDRIDNSKGYTIENVLPCCSICNQTRNKNWTVEETKIMISAVMNHRKILCKTQSL